MPQHVQPWGQNPVDLESFRFCLPATFSVFACLLSFMTPPTREKCFYTDKIAMQHPIRKLFQIAVLYPAWQNHLKCVDKCVQFYREINSFQMAWLTVR